MIEIQPPTNCPSCQFRLEWSNHLLYCKNPSCGTQAAKRIEHFAKTLKIKGLGPASIEKLGLTDLEDIYLHTEESLAECLSSEKLAEKLYAEITNSKGAPLNSVLPAFSIPLIGKTATEKLSTVCENIFDIDIDTCRRAGIGPKATENLLSWLNKEFLEQYANLPLNFDFVTKSLPQEVSGVVCISGKLKSFKTKAEAADALSQRGYTVKSGLTKDVTILVNESGIESAKTKKARDSGITVVNNLLEFLGEI